VRYDLEVNIMYSKLSLQLPRHGSGSWSQTCYLRRPWFDPRSVYVIFVVDKVIPSSFSSEYCGFTLSIIIPPMLLNHINLSVVLTRRINGRYLGTFQTAMLLRELRNIG